MGAHFSPELLPFVRAKVTDRAAMRTRPRSVASIERLRHLRRASGVAGRSGSRLFPWRRRPTSYSVLLAEVLLQNTPSERVVPVFEDVVRRWPTFRRLAAASATSLARVLEPLGLQRRRARALVAIATELVSRQSRLPRDARDLRRLPGVGPYTAGATATVAFRRPTPFTDAGTERLIRRYFGLPIVRTAAVDDLAFAVLTGGDPRARLWGLLDLARTCCRPRPRCGCCPLASRCAHTARAVAGRKGR